ncbi:hypothetical protein SAMN05216323_102219 [Williamwhitmania taraxaci]|uniref:Uncharacterized protein n=1 Tax=Williamwhitmania taraxaci TaxID=1640674 RepID=A0A1G6JXX7_9BACT|nr:hypothetical protein SAMN05216323_102219 [Williamwhitmania taraxaci]
MHAELGFVAERIESSKINHGAAVVSCTFNMHDFSIQATI